MPDDSIELRWRRQGFTVDDKAKSKLRPRLTRKKRNFAEPRSRKVSSEASNKQRQPKSSDDRKASTSGTASNNAFQDRRRRCVVKVNYVRHGSSICGGAAPLKAHARYLERDSAEASDPFGQGYLTRHGQDMFGKDTKGLAEWQADRHHFRLVISPEHADRLDMQAFTTGFMQALEQKLYQTKSATAPLEWVAVTHYNTAHPHSHVVLRGKTQDGRDLVIPKKVISHGMRELGRDLVTHKLGYRLHHEIVQDLKLQDSMNRMTELDGEIMAKARADKKTKIIDPASLDEYGRARLDWLIEHGYAIKAQKPAGSISLAPDFAELLRSKDEEKDVVRSLQRSSAKHDLRTTMATGDQTATQTIHRYQKNLDAPALFGKVRHIQPIDELTDRFAAIVQDEAGKSWLVEISHGQADRLAVGDEVKISTARTLPNGKTTRAPFIRIENLAPAKPMTQAPGLPGFGLIKTALAQPSAPARGMSLDLD